VESVLREEESTVGDWMKQVRFKPRMKQ